MADYYSIITNRGKELEAEALTSGRPIVLTQFVVGDSNGQQIKPDPEQIRLVNETFRGDIADLVVSPEQTSQLMAKIVLPTDVGGFTVREVGLLTDAGELFAVANCPSIDKPVGGVSVNMQFRLAVSDTSNITLNVATGDGLFLRIDQNLKEIKARGDDAQRESRESIGIFDATTQQKGLVQLNSAVNSTSETQGATPAAVRIAMDNANARLAKERNGADIPNKPLFIQNVGLQETVNKAGGAVQRTGDEMIGKLTVPQISSVGVNTENALGGNSIAIGDSDTGFKQLDDGVLALMANGAQAGYFSLSELQHKDKMLSQIFRALVNNSLSAGAGGFAGQADTEAPFYVTPIQRPQTDNNYFPLIKQKIILDVGYPVTFSMGLLTTGKTTFPQIVIQAKTDTESYDRLWILDVQTGDIRIPGRVLLGDAIFTTSGDAYGSVWGNQWLSSWLSNAFASRDNNINTRATYDWVRLNFVQDVRLGGAATTPTINDMNRVPNGCVMVGIDVSGGTYNPTTIIYQPIQKWVNDQWYNVGAA